MVVCEGNGVKLGRGGCDGCTYRVGGDVPDNKEGAGGGGGDNKLSDRRSGGSIV